MPKQQSAKEKIEHMLKMFRLERFQLQRNGNWGEDWKFVNAQIQTLEKELQKAKQDDFND